MKILQIRFQNLNSLAGSWHIDFTHPAYTSHSLFAITGPTGAGKSTLLDAVCLALYGRTPRLPRISKSSNEIMSRHTGFCWAEVEFITVKGHFRCHWSQHRSRKKATGDLQPPKHEISDAKDDTLLESKIKKVAVKVEEVTGMDFDRFTRSTLLAQGGFAAFLEASADNRAPLLEQITGTAIYSRISIKVHELRAEELKKLQLLEQTLEQTDLLSPEQEEEFKQSVLRNNASFMETNKLLEKERMQLNWLRELGTLRLELSGLMKQLTELSEEEKVKKEELSLLQPALEAEEINPLFQTLTDLLKSIAETEESIQQQKTKAELHLGKQKEIGETLQHADTACKLAEETLTTGLQVIKEVEEIDLQKCNALAEQSKHNKQLQTLDKQLHTLTLERRTLLTEGKRVQTQQGELALYFKKHAEDEHLSEELLALKLEINSLDSSCEKEKNLKNAQEKAANDSKRKAQQLNDLQQETQVLQSHIRETEKTCKHYQERISEISGSKKRNDIEKELLSTSLRLQSTAELLSLTQQVEELRNSLQQRATHLHTEADSIDLLHTQLKSIRQKTEDKRLKLELLEKNQLLLARISSLEEERDNLRDGNPCPLCGSLSHPYSRGNTPEISQAEKEVSSARKQLKNLEQDALGLEKKLSEGEEKKKNLTSQIAADTKRNEETGKKAEEILSGLNFPALADTDQMTIQKEQQNLHHQRQQLQKVSNTLDTLNEQLQGAEKQLKESEQSLQRNEKELLKGMHHNQTAEETSKRLAKENNELLARLEKEKTRLFSKLTTLRVESPTLSALSDIYKSLQQRVARWKKNKKGETDVNMRLADIRSHIEHKKENEKALRTTLAENRKQGETLQLAIDILSEKRTKCFGDKNTKEETKQLNDTVKKAQKARERLQKQAAYNSQELSSALTLQTHLSKEKLNLGKKISHQEKLFENGLEASSFADKDTFLAARQSSETIKELTHKQELLRSRRNKLETLLNDTKKRVADKEEKKLCLMKEEELLEQIKEHEKQCSQLQKTVATLEHQLKTNKKNQDTAALQLSKVKQQKKVCGCWNRLHTLIGSSDGKKFRNFAQGLTFETMVKHANTTLAKMSDRYILIRDKNQPLDLNVIDLFQGGEIRSTRNLSGGESFLVSLALALGLSKMASSTIRVDSLFLDEGFGTLDEDALESALDTLAGLQEENKLIGIISHVPALKERIPIQIEAIPGQGGNNSIKGPGVTNIPA